MGYAEKRGDYWRARYKIEPGKYGTVADGTGATARFRTKREAEQAADSAEADVRGGRWRDPAAGRITFGEFVTRWFAGLDLAESTMETYKLHIEGHLLPVFEGVAVVDILAADISAWEKRELAAGYSPGSVKNWRATLHLILGDAVEEGLREANPAARRRGRGKRAGRSRHRGPEKPITTLTSALMVAERAALLSGRDEEFLAVVLMTYTGMRWGEVVGLETRYVRPGQVRIEWQLYELDTGRLLRCPPKDDSRRTIDVPTWLSDLLSQHIVRSRPQPCDCHGFTYVFRGHGAARGASRQVGAKLADVARRAGVAIGTASNVLARPEIVATVTREKVLEAMRELGYVRGGAPSRTAAHWRRSGFSTWLFQPAVTGLYPARAPRPAHPVPLVAEPWPGMPIRGRYGSARVELCWMPLAPGLTPHGLRHTHRTLMEELMISPKLMDERMGHEDGSVQARYTHITPEMRRRLVDGLTERWEAALAARRAMAARSPVEALDELLKEEASTPGGAPETDVPPAQTRVEHEGS